MSTSTDTATDVTDVHPDAGPLRAPDALLGHDTLLGDRPRMRIGAEWVTSDETRPVENPATGERIADVPEASQQHVPGLAFDQGGDR